MASAASCDVQSLENAGFAVRWIRRSPTVYTAEISSEEGQSTRLEWVVDSDFRFFPVVPDDMFGYVLHPVDLAANKVMAAAGRREPRDLVDLLKVDKTILPLGPVIWAAVEKSPGYTPEGLIAEIRRNMNYPAAEWQALMTPKPLNPATVLTALREALTRADDFVAQMPSSKLGLLFLDDGRVVQPDPARLDGYQTHSGRTRGHWPATGEISSAMLERYRSH